MEYRFLGNSGLQVSALSFGAWVTFGKQVKDAVARECMALAYERGINFFDNAEVYAGGEAERVMGKLLAEFGWERESYVVSSKVFWGGEGPNRRGLSRKHIVEGTNGALRRLGLEYVDLLFCHRPDPDTPMEETVHAMNLMIQQGKALYWGTSEWSAQQITEAHAVARREHWVPPLMEQPQYHMFHRTRFEVEYAPLYRNFGMGTTIWSPLGGGLLTGKYNDGMPEGTRATLAGMEFLLDRYQGEAAQSNVEKVRSLTPLAQELGGTMAQLALAWCLKNPHVSTAITGASRAEQLRENLGALELVEKLDDGAMERIEEILDNRPAPPDRFR